MPPGGLVSGSVAALTDRGLRRQTNQDAVLVQELAGGWTLLAVADGVGGSFGGEIASEVTINALRETFASATFDDPAVVLRTAYRAANRAVFVRGDKEPALNEMATTLVAALVRDGSAWVANLGDSRAYLFADGATTQLTEDDSVVAQQVRAGLLTQEQAERSPYQNVITRSIGVERDLEQITVTPVTLNPGALLLLCSDGLFRPLTIPEIAMLVRQGDLDAIARELIDRANANGGPDNITVALYRQPIDTITE